MPCLLIRWQRGSIPFGDAMLLTILEKPRQVSMDLFIKSVWADRVFSGTHDVDAAFLVQDEAGRLYLVKLNDGSMALRYRVHRLDDKVTEAGYSLN